MCETGKSRVKKINRKLNAIKGTDVKNWLACQLINDQKNKQSDAHLQSTQLIVAVRSKKKPRKNVNCTLSGFCDNPRKGQNILADLT